MFGRMMKFAAFAAIALTATASFAASGKSCAEISGHAAAMSGCGGVVLASVQPLMFDEVTRIQHKLNFLGYNLGKSGVDGKLGAYTKAAIKQFQRDHKLRVDGRIGVQTRTMLNYVTQQYRAYGQ